MDENRRKQSPFRGMSFPRRVDENGIDSLQAAVPVSRSDEDAWVPVEHVEVPAPLAQFAQGAGTLHFGLLLISNQIPKYDQLLGSRLAVGDLPLFQEHREERSGNIQKVSCLLDCELGRMARHRSYVSGVNGYALSHDHGQAEMRD